MSTTRRELLRLSGMGAAMLVTALLAGPARAMMHMGEGGGMPTAAEQMLNLDPTDAVGFVTPLLRPSHQGGILGIHSPILAFSISAQPGAVTILPGTETDLLVYSVKWAGHLCPWASREAGAGPRGLAAGRRAS